MHKHGMSNTPTYNTWVAMRSRCDNPNHSSYKNYGGRGITYDSRWSTFTNFYNDMAVRPEGKTLDRIDNDKPYTKDNCRWSTDKEQKNNKKTNRMLTLDGTTLTLRQWSERVGICETVINKRLKRGWTVEEALTIKPKLGNRVK